jgi:beta-mannosidase
MKIDLAGEWSLASADGVHKVALSFPGDAISALRDAGVIPDPYFGANELLCRWVCDLDWVAARTFDLPPGETGDGWYLDIDGLDTVASIKINGQLVLSAKNAFRRYRPDVSNALKPGQNNIEVVFQSNVKAAAEEQAKQPFFIPYHAGNCPIPHGNMLRKPQCHFGWDWNLAVPPFGVYGTFALKRMDTGRIESIKAEQSHAKGRVSVLVETAIWCHAARSAAITVSLAGQSITETVDWAEGQNWHRIRFEIENPKLWWPAGSGEQPLYDLLVTFDGQTEQRRIGLRTIALINEPDAAGSRFAFKVNGREIFCRGANWIPADALPSGATAEHVERLVKAALQANMNMLRVWGGGFYETEQFYDLCDELGILVWQDAMFSCHLYPSTPSFLDEVKAELAYQAARLQHRACLALWCGDNELIGALTWFEPSIKDRDRYLVNYDRLNRTVEDAIRAQDLTTPWWPSSPSPGPLSFGDAWHADGSGDMHFWSVWHEGKPFEHYRDVKPRFCSEFGFQSYPSMNAVKRFAEEKDWNIAAPVFEHHQKNAGGNARITETMFRSFRFPKDFQNFVYLSQIQHGLAMKTAIDYWRSLKPHCMGTLYWQLNDTWPVCSWSGLDHGGDWKLMHHMARRFFLPVNVVAIPDKDRQAVRFWGINDRIEARVVELSVHVTTVEGARRSLLNTKADLSPNAAIDLGLIETAALKDGEFLIFNFQTDDGNGTDLFLPAPFKTYTLPDPALSITETAHPFGRKVFTISAEKTAFFVSLETQLLGRFSDNAFHLPAGEKRQVEFLPGNGPLPSLLDITIRHLQSSYQ